VARTHPGKAQIYSLASWVKADTLTRSKKV
jgi:hypothetical protein